MATFIDSQVSRQYLCLASKKAEQFPCLELNGFVIRLGVRVGTNQIGIN